METELAWSKKQAWHLEPALGQSRCGIWSQGWSRHGVWSRSKGRHGMVSVTDVVAGSGVHMHLDSSGLSGASILSAGPAGPVEGACSACWPPPALPHLDRVVKPLEHLSP